MSVELRDVTIAYDGVTAVEGFDLTIQDGELVVLLGPSGCGKTSVMRSIVGLEKPTKGTITIHDRVVFDGERGIDVPVNRRHVGMVFQSYAIWPHMTVLENVAFPLKVARQLSKSEVTARTMEVLATVGLESFADRPASHLSGGQMQRVALARSIAMNPFVMLLDEPLSNLDAKMRDRLRFELKELHDSLGLTALYVTHDLSEALALGDRIAVMHDGKIVQMGTPREVYAHPNSAFVADFLGIANLFPGVLEAGPDPDQPDVVTVRLDGHDAVVRAVAPSGMPPGSEVIVCLPPENLRLRKVAPAGAGNAWDCTVVSTNFLGAQTRYRLETDSGLHVDATHFGPGGALVRGDRGLVCVEPADVQLLPAEPAT